jgi:hypothetical protein
MNPRQLLIVAGIAIAGFGAAFLVSGSSGDGGAEPVEAAKQPAAAEVLEVAGAQVKVAAPASGALPKLKVPKPKTEETSTSTTTTTTTTDTTDTTAPTTQTTTPTTQTTTPTTQTTQPTTNNNNDSGNGGFIQTGGED